MGPWLQHKACSRYPRVRRSTSTYSSSLEVGGVTARANLWRGKEERQS